MYKHLTLRFLEDQLVDLEEEYESTKEQYRGETDPRTRQRLKRQIKKIESEMDKCQQEIYNRQQELNRLTMERALDNLIDILQYYEGQFETIIKAYRQTISHWSASVTINVETVDAIVSELEKIAQGKSSYTAQSEFIARVVRETSEPTLSSALNQWGKQYREGIDWLELYGQIQETQGKRLEDAQPAILMTITRSDEASTQSKDGDRYYCLNAWLIEDIETYRSKKTGYHPLIVTGSADAEPCLLPELLQNMTQVLNNCLTEKNRLCDRCKNDPQVHVFLPLELMNLGVDVWRLDEADSRRPEYLGHKRVVVLRCASRYERTYKDYARWQTLWSRYQCVVKECAQTVFIPGCDDDLDELRELLDEKVKPKDSKSKIVGLHVTQAPVDIKGLCYELLDAGLPLAIWSRQNLADAAHEAQLLGLLQACCLERLPHTVQERRYETRNRKNTPDCHIGHHLSLLWDDPYLVPPKSA